METGTISTEWPAKKLNNLTQAGRARRRHAAENQAASRADIRGADEISESEARDRGHPRRVGAGSNHHCDEYPVS